MSGGSSDAGDIRRHTFIDYRKANGPELVPPSSAGWRNTSSTGILLHMLSRPRGPAPTFKDVSQTKLSCPKDKGDPARSSLRHSSEIFGEERRSPVTFKTYPEG